MTAPEPADTEAERFKEALRGITWHGESCADVLDRLLAATSPAPEAGLRDEATIKAEALREAIEDAHTEQAALRAAGRLDEQLDLLQHWSATRGWLRSRIRAYERGDEPNWPDAMNSAAAPEAGEQ